MSLKQVKLTPEDSEEFVKLLKADADQEELAAFLEGKNPTDVPEEKEEILEVITKLETLAADEAKVLLEIFKARAHLMDELTVRLLGNGASEVMMLTEDPKVEQTSSQAEETKPTSTDQKTLN